MICLSCTGATVKEDLQLIKKNLEYIDILEIRADFLSPPELRLLSSFPGFTELPCILSFRSPESGGRDSGISPEERTGLIEKALDGDWAFLDIENDSETEVERRLVKKAEDEGIRVIKSVYDFTGVPDNLAETMFEICRGDRFIPRAELRPQSSADLLRLRNAHSGLCRLRDSSQGMSCINGPFLSDYIICGTGAYGMPSRVMACAWGSMLTYCTDDSFHEEGQLDPRVLNELYNYSELTADTAVFGIIGHPVMHTKSPALHNPALQQKGIDAVYLPFETADPEVLLARAEELNLKGLSVTIPHKRQVMELADSLDESVEAIGACNTLVHDGQWRGYNTDWLGFLKPLETDSLEGRRALVIGAGGASRAVVYALVKRGMDVTIVNRSPEKAASLAADFGCRGGGFDLVSGGNEHSLIVQTTSVGMAPAIDPDPPPGF